MEVSSNKVWRMLQLKLEFQRSLLMIISFNSSKQEYFSFSLGMDREMVSILMSTKMTK
jgi:sulfopyruvate decarboxylase TPP-binding subunit